MAMRWYVVHAFSGFEKKVQREIIERAKREGLAEKFGEILVPTEEIVEMRNGQKTSSQRMFYPGYVLVQMDMDEESWHLVKNTPRVTGFVGGSVGAPIRSRSRGRRHTGSHQGGRREAAAQIQL